MGDFSNRVIRCIINVHQKLGPGFVERIYKRALLVELHLAGFRFETEKEIVLYYEGTEVGRHRLDLLVEETLIVELKAVTALNKTHYAQLRSYLAATGLPVGLLVNFDTFPADFRRVYARSRSSP